ncbi:MAG: hypothetical protein EOQ69_28835 [Mesorhizobium sp.]|nr:MAG: hypothetical protein EOQ69_28835 [Mesorhizobium sp.]
MRGTEQKAEFLRAEGLFHPRLRSGGGTIQNSSHIGACAYPKIEAKQMISHKPSETTKVGVIFPVSDVAKFPYELIDDEFVSSWLAAHGLNAEYISAHTPDGDYVNYQSKLEYCEYLAREDILAAAARSLKEKGCDSMVWACTSASFFKGLLYAQHQVRLLSENSGVPATSTSMAFLAALGVLGAKKVDIMLPYVPEIAKTLVSFLEEGGIRVGTVWHMKRRGGGRAFEMDSEAELSEFVSSMPVSNDPIVMPCTSISSLNRVEMFEKISGRPILTANQVSLWHGLVLAGATPRILNAGSFLKVCAVERYEGPQFP